MLPAGGLATGRRRARCAAQPCCFPLGRDLAAPPATTLPRPALACRHTKLLTLKPKYIIENQTGLPMLMKQCGTADPDPRLPDPGRFARVLPPGSRCGWGGGRAASALG